MSLLEKKDGGTYGAGAKQQHDQIGKLILVIEHTVTLHSTRQNSGLMDTTGSI